jgi:hypothetical protein
MNTLARTSRMKNRRVVTLFALALAATALLASPTIASAWEPGVALSTPYPRLAMWWPNTYTQSAEQLARYDWLALTEVDRHAIRGIRALNADEILLNSTNASELHLDPSSSIAGENAEISALPAQWLITQVGSTLSAPIGAASTSIPVAALIGSSGGRSVALFAVGDNIVIDDEIMHVTGINAGAHTLTVSRGFAKRAASHDAGARVASTVSFWPNSALVDLTSSCPRVSVDASADPETWAEYNARIGAALATSDDWDGILTDGSNGNESWLVDAGYARSIDPARTNTFPTDGYAAFDEAWNAGLTGYELRMRGLLGTGKIIFSNWGHPNFEILNGNNFENFPSVDPIDYPWQRLVEGPSTERGSYFEWLARSQQPNLTTIQTYQDESLPQGDDDNYVNPAARRGFVPNYQKMRYGLTTALLGDGFFSYEVGTTGHGSLGLMWFDEYDGAGRGRGYLGQPIAPARRVWDLLPSGDSLSGDGSFDTQAKKDKWGLQTVSPARATAVRDTTTVQSGAGSLRVNVSVSDGVYWHAKTYHPVSVTRGTEYTLSFWARSDATHTVESWIQQAHSPWNSTVTFTGPDDATVVTPQWQRFTISGKCSTTDSKSWVVLAFGDSAGTVWLDDVQVRRGNPNVWRRTYANGIAVVNSSESAIDVPLGGLYRGLQGGQSPSVNNGRLVSSVVISPRDGRVLVKPDLARAAAYLRSAHRNAVYTSRYSRQVSSYYAKKAKRGSRASRKKAAKARVAWRRAALAAESLTRDLVTARKLVGSGDYRLAWWVAHADTYASTLAWRVTAARKTGRAPGAAKRARTAADAARYLVHHVAYSAR